MAKINPKLKKRYMKDLSPHIIRFCDLLNGVARVADSVIESKGLSLTDIAAHMKVDEEELSKMLCGWHNFTLGEIARLEAAIGEKLINITKE